MITDIPKAEEYENSAIECLVQAYNNIIQVEKSNSKKIPKEELWKYNQIVLRTSIVLIHQGVECLMKSFICDESPLLLIDKKRVDWKTLPKSPNESFSDLYTIGGEDLLRTFYSCIEKDDELDDKFLGHYEEIRTKRNKIIHGIGEENLAPEYIINLILWSFTYILGKDSFWNAVLEKFDNHPGLKYNDEEIELEEVFQNHRIEYLKNLIGKAELKHHFQTDITSRAYYCPECTQYMNMMVGDETRSKWAFLNPNLPESESLNCIVCQIHFKVIREDCIKANCKGNVKYFAQGKGLFQNDIKICLTCWNEENHE